MDLKTLTAENPALVQEIEALGVEKFKATLKSGADVKKIFLAQAGELETGASKTAVEGERKRIAAIHAASFPGQETLVKGLVESGATEAEAMGKIVADLKDPNSQANKNRELGKMKGEDPGNLGANTLGDGKGGEVKTFEGLVAKIEQERKVSHGKAISLAAKENPKLHDAWLAEQEKKQGFTK